MIQVRLLWFGWRFAFPELQGQTPIPPKSGGPIQRSILGGGLAWGRYLDGERFTMIGPGELRWRRL